MPVTKAGRGTYECKRSGAEQHESGRIVCSLFWVTSCLYMIRLLKTCMIGCSAAAGRLLVEPHVFEPPAVKEAVDHHPQTLHVGMPTGRITIMGNDRPRPVFLYFSVDLPHQLLPLLRGG